ncbi:MAG: hypothetical protein ABS46_03230 [Cytophagaceae bacterium SCN 52-12]|nr:MAG: hypothetical protein ABS46_03230 [Cytophagaceae bacterium SCN 52-12]
MKKTTFALMLLTALAACKNQEIEFPDFDYTTGYFPYQYPVRTLVLGKDIYDNTNDNDHKFLISTTMGGVYENTMDRIFKIQVDNSLCEKALFASTQTPIRPLPQEYYTLSSPDQIVIPAGKVSGSIEVQLKDAFFDDTLAIGLSYVVPIRISQVTNLDSVLRGNPALPSPDPRITSHWQAVPKDFTMFAIRYVNPYHGNYFHRGRSTLKDSTGQVAETTAYRQPYITSDEVWKLTTTSKNQVSATGVLRSAIVTGPLNLLLTFSGENCTVNSGKDFPYEIKGTGKFLSDADEWGNKKRDAIHISYEFSDGKNTYSATDTLVVRDRGVIMEVYQPVISQ